MADKFNGIAMYHNGLAVSDYVNMIPRGSTCIDRQGADVIESSLVGQDSIRGHYMDSLGNVYIVIRNVVHRFVYDRDTDSVAYAGLMSGYIGDDFAAVFHTVMMDTPVSFCESSTKPSQVYMCDGRYIYWWATEDTQNYPAKRQAFQMTMLWSPNVFASGVSDTPQPDQYYKILNPADSALDTSDIAFIDSIDWFDNKLVAVQKSKNTVWLTCTDPGQFFRLGTKDPFTEDDGTDLWHNWYASTNSSDRLNTVVAFGGQLYFLNNHSIEIWGRTGNEDSPIQSNTTQVIHHGARNPLIIADTLYVIANDQIGGEYIAAINNGQFARISNPEIERRLDRPIDLKMLSQHEETYLMVRLQEQANGEATAFVFSEGRWWRWLESRDETRKLYASIVRNVAVSTNGIFFRFTDEHRRTAGGKRIVRRVRDCFVNFDGRKIIRRVALNMDTGIRHLTTVIGDGMERMIYLKVSTNRGLSFSQEHYRRLGLSGQNNKVIEWRNLGSCNSILIEFGCTADYSLQIYDVIVDLQ